MSFRFGFLYKKERLEYGQKSSEIFNDSRNCSGFLETEVTAKEVIFTDDLGREVTVEEPQRVAALLGSYAENAYFDVSDFMII